MQCPSFSNMNLLSKIHKKNPFLARGSLLILAAAFASFINFLYNAYLGRTVSIEDFGLISFFGGIVGISDIFIGALGKTVTYKSAYLLGRYKIPASSFWKKLRKRGLLISLFLSIGWIAASPFISSFFRIEDILPVLLFAPIWIFSIMSSIDGGYLGGSLFLGYMGIAGIVDAVTKLLLAQVLVSSGFEDYAFLSMVFSTFITFMFIYVGTRQIKKGKLNTAKEVISFPKQFYYSSIITKLSTVAFLSFDVILAKHYLTAAQAGEYALLSLTGKIIFIAGSFFAQFVTPLVSHREGKGKGAYAVFNKLLLATSFASLIAFAVVGLFSTLTIPILFGDHAKPILYLVPFYTLSMVAFTLSSTIVTFHQIKERHLLPVLSFIFAIFQIGLIGIFHDSLQSIAYVMIGLGFSSLLVIGLLHFLYPRIKTPLANFTDFFDLLRPIDIPQNVEGLKILVFNWRDTKHVWAGGAEVYIREMAKKWADNKNYVMLFCGNDGLNKRNETIQNVRIIRRGGFYMVYLWAVLYYIFKFRNKFDVIVDSENGIPFFSPLFSTKPVVLLIHHVHQEIFREHLSFPFSEIARFIEGKIMPFVYRNRLVVTVSESSKKEIIKNRIANENNIQVINPGIDMSAVKVSKTLFPSVLYLGRLKPYKNIDVAIKAFSKIAKENEKAKFYIVGEGESRYGLEKLTHKLNLTKQVKFLGRVSETKKNKLLASSWIAVQPSQIEGWGITVIEANACATPVIASRTNGLVDSIQHNKTGILVKLKDVNAFSQAIHELLNDKKKRDFLSKNAKIWTNNFNWNTNSNAFEQILNSAIAKKNTFTLPRITYIYDRITSLF